MTMSTCETRDAGGHRCPTRFMVHRHAVASGSPRDEPVHQTGRRTAGRLLRIVILVVLAGYLLFTHGCHGDEDTELFAWLARAVGL